MVNLFPRLNITSLEPQILPFLLGKKSIPNIKPLAGKQEHEAKFGRKYLLHTFFIPIHALEKPRE